MRAIMVCVDFADILALTLPRNRKHFEEVWVVTSNKDADTQKVAVEHKCHVYCTGSFYANGAAFNKWLALEEGLDRMGRKGWLCQMDADVVWPEKIVVEECGMAGVVLAGGDGNAPLLTLRHEGKFLHVIGGQLCSPLRRMCPFDGTVPPESQWRRFPVHRNVAEWAGYSQIFHADDPVLGPPPWHQVDWIHAGGADSFFQAKWGEQPPGWKPGMAQQTNRKVRPPFEVLHLGEAGRNWYGRATPYADGRLPEGSADKLQKCRRIWVERQNRRRLGQDPFEPEKLS